MWTVKALAASCGGDIADGLNRRDLDVALRQWVEMNADCLTATGGGRGTGGGGGQSVDQLERVGRLMMTIGSRLEAGDSAENDQMAIKRRVEAVWKLRRVRIGYLRSQSVDESGIFKVA